MADNSTNQTVVPAVNVNPSQVEQVRSPYFRTVFASNMRIITSPVEVRITFSHVTDTARDGETVYQNEDEVCVVIPPALIRTMLTIIETSLKNHEKLWGALPAPLINEESSEAK